MGSMGWALFRSIPHIIWLGLSLLFLSITLRWRIWRTKKAFERELRHGGMAKEDAQRLSQVYDSARAHLWSFLKEAGSKERTVS